MGKLLERRTDFGLREGDRLTSDEFMRRYEETPEGFRAELISGVVAVNRWFERGPDGVERIVPPITALYHGRPHTIALFAIAHYSFATEGVRGSAAVTVILSPIDSVAEPDALLRIDNEWDGSCHHGVDDFLHGPPELVVEIADTTAERDRGPKFDMYRRCGVQEYLVWSTREKRIEWFHHEDGEYVPLSADTDGILKSRVFPGLWLDPAAMIAGDMAKVLAVVQQGIASPEHANFVEKLRKKAGRKKRS